MRKYTKSKGQWFLISAVIISYSLASIFSMINSYSSRKYYWGLINKAGYSIRNVENYLNLTTQMSPDDYELDHSINFLVNKLAEEGIYANITYEKKSGKVIYHVNLSSDTFSVHRVIAFP